MVGSQEKLQELSHDIKWFLFVKIVVTILKFNIFVNYKEKSKPLQRCKILRTN